MSSRVLSFCAVANLSLIIVLYNFQSVCDVWSLGAGVRVAVEVLIVAMMGVWSEESSVECPYRRGKFLIWQKSPVSQGFCVRLLASRLGNRLRALRNYLPVGLFLVLALLFVVSLDPHRVLLLLKSPPAMKVFPREWKNFSNLFASRLCFGGQYTAVIAMSLNGPLTFMDVACISASVQFSSSKCAIVDLMRMAVPPWADPLGWLVQQRL